VLRRRPAWAQPPQIVGEESAPDDQHPFVPKRSQLSPPEYVISPGPYRWSIVWRELHTDLPEQRVGLVLVTAGGATVMTSGVTAVAGATVTTVGATTAAAMI
jgi:hypothetical protein